MTSTTASKKYEKKDPIEHVLLRPDMYVGSTIAKLSSEFVCEKVENEGDEGGHFFQIIKKDVNVSLALLRIFIEILSNSVDNVFRSRQANIPCSYIKIKLNKETGETSVINDGDIIPIEINPENKMYNHTLVFGNLLSGSNFDDEKERLISGKNGLGSSLCNIFSTKFIVKGLDPNNNKTFQQTWTNNMKTVGEPIIEKTKLTKGYTSVCYFPDFKQFKMNGYDDETISMYLKLCVDAAMLTKVKVYFNDDLIPVNNLQSYAKLYKSDSEDSLFLKTDNSEVLLQPCNQFQTISFVNGIYTKLGGEHVDGWSEALFRPIVDKFNSKKGSPSLNIGDIKRFFRLFVVSYVVNPVFDSQSKNKLESPSVKAVVKNSDIAKIMKWSVIEDIEDIIKSKEMIVLKKTEKKKRGYVKIDGLDAANFSGTKESHLCSLILCEGLSARTFCIQGLQKGVNGLAGRNYFGVYSLKGKLLNCRNSNSATIAKNAVITDLIQALNLQYGVDYTNDENFKSLSYGKVIILTDADVDGCHISSLLMNFFHYLFPTLLKRKEPFLTSMLTPIVRVFGKDKSKDLLFYDEEKYKKFAEENPKHKSKYYKGLGTCKQQDVTDTFGEKIVEYLDDENTEKSINKVFNKKFADERKKWIESYNPSNNICFDGEAKNISLPLSEYLEKETIKFSREDCLRSIAMLYDGLKESQRKILYGAKKRNLTHNKTALKVAQMGAYVAEITDYKHGEQNLYDTIIKMAQEFVGSNNIPYFMREGMMGSRNSSGKDFASPRYVFTKMEILTPLLFREEDDVLLNHVYDGNDMLEPKMYIPIIPTILVNGSLGIGTGFSCNIPSFNPKDIIYCVKIWLENINSDVITKYPELIPWYRGFTGQIIKNGDKFITTGIFTKEKNKVIVTELPVSMSIDTFKEMIENWMSEKKIKAFKNYSTPNKAYFVITEDEDGMSCNLKNMKLEDSISLSNMVLFDDKYNLKKYTLEKIINDFCEMRYSFYDKRKKYILNKLEYELRFLSNKMRFIKEVTERTLNVMNISEEIIISELEKKGYDKEIKDKKNNENDDENEEINGGGYNYLLRLHVRTFTTNKVKELQNDIINIEDKIKNVKQTTLKKMWLRDLDEFEMAYEKWLKQMESILDKEKNIVTDNKTTTKKTKKKE
jgi:DNA topoisomerase-2